MNVPTGDAAHNALLERLHRWEAARTEYDRARRALVAAIVRSTLPQAEIARTLGWPRQRVNTVLKERK